MEAEGDTKHEWINGLIYAMSRGTPEHGRLSAAMVRALPETEQCRVYSSDTLIYIEKAEHSTYVLLRVRELESPRDPLALNLHGRLVSS